MHSKEIVVIKTKTTEEAKMAAKTMAAATKTSVNKNTWALCWKLQAKKAALEVNNENEFHEDQEQTHEEDTPVSTVFPHSYSKNQ